MCTGCHGAFTVDAVEGTFSTAAADVEDDGAFAKIAVTKAVSYPQRGMRLTMAISELVDHGKAASAPVAHNRRGNGNPATQNGL